MLSAHDLECVKGYTALFEGVSFSVTAGQIVQITGRNGAGKTSLLRILAGLSLPETGEVRWQEMPILEDRAAYYQQMAYLGHLNGLKDELTALENLHAHTALLAQQTTTTPKAALESVGLAGYEDVTAYQLSAGQKRRLSLARLSLGRASLWLLDEPTTAIDVDGVAAFEQHIQRHANAGGMVVFTSHQSLDFGNADFRTVSVSDTHS